MNLLTLSPTAAIATTTTTPAKPGNGAPRNLTVQCNFVYGSGGTSMDLYLQTSLDGAITWCDIAQFHVTTTSERYVYNLYAGTPVTTEYSPTDGSMSSNTSKDGVLGPQFRVKYTSSGTYAATTVSVDIQGDQIPSFP